MLDRNRTPSLPFSYENDRFEKIVNQAPRRKSSAAPKPKTAAKKQIASAATKASTTSPAPTTSSTTAPALRKLSTPVSQQPRPRANPTPNQDHDPTDDEEKDARTARRKSRVVTCAQVKVYNPGQNRRKPVVLEDEEEDTVDALAIDPTSPRDEGMFEQSSDEEDDQCDLPKLTAKSGARRLATMNTTLQDSAPHGPTLPALPLRSTAGSEVNDDFIGEGNQSARPTLQVTPKRMIVSKAPSQAAPLECTDVNRKQEMTNHTSGTPPRRHASVPSIPRTFGLVAASSLRSSTAVCGLSGGSEFEYVRRSAGHRGSINREGITCELEPDETAPNPTQNFIDEHENDDLMSADEGYITTFSDDDKLLTPDLDKEAEAMLSHIIRLACLPGEWLRFLESDDYTISRGESTVREAGHSHDAKDVLQYLLRKVNDLSAPRYCNTYVDYENIYVTSNTVRNSRTHSAPEIWTPFCSLHKLLNKRDELSFSSKAAECNAVWKDVVDKTPFLFETQRTPYAQRHWSFVVLFVNTCAPQLTLCQALTGANETHEWVYRDQVLGLLGHLCREIKDYKGHTVGEIVQIWDHLHHKLLKAYEMNGAPVTDIEASEVSPVTQRESHGLGRTTKRKSPEHLGRDGEARKRKAVLT
jgi:hypothetical protein